MSKEKSKISRYVDTTGELSNTQLKFGEWYLSHKILLQKIGVGMLIAWCVVTIGFSFFKWGEYLFFGYEEDQRGLLVGQLSEFQNYEVMRDLYGAQDISILDARVFGSSEDMYDFFATVANPNERWIANVSYHFDYSGGETEIYNTALLPGSKRPLAIFGHESQKFPSTVNFVVDEISWQNIDPHKIFDINSYVKPRSMFSIDNMVFKEPSEDGILVPSISFDLYNDSAYSYWQPVFYVELLNGSQTVGYIFLSVDQFRLAEKKEIDLRYFGGDITVTDIRLIPVINFFDEEVYMASGD